MTSTRTPRPPAVPARTTSRSAHEPRPPTPSSKSYPSVDRGASRQAGTGPTPAASPNGPAKHSDFEVVDVDDAANETESSVDEHLPPLPPLPIFNGSAKHGTRKDVIEAEHNSKPVPGPSIVQQSRVIDLPVPKGPSSEARKKPQARVPGATDTSTNRQEDEWSNAEATSPPSSSKDAPDQNPKIFIPKIPPVSPTISPPDNLSTLAAGLEGKYVDEFGNILDWHGHVLGRVEGDLPSMVGRPISSTGEVLNTEGQVVGFVVENDTIKAPEGPKAIEGVAGPGLRVDHSGNILDSTGTIVGRLKNNAKDGDAAPKAPATSTPPPDAPQFEKKETCSCGQPKSSATPSPSEIYLDVKSTNDGIQLIIKIPTIFNKTPVVQISSS